MGCSPWGRKESDTTERLHFHFSLACLGEGNGNPLQYSRLENPRDGGAWWAAVYGVAQSRTRLKRLGSSSRAHTRATLRYSRLHYTMSHHGVPCYATLHLRSHIISRETDDSVVKSARAKEVQGFLPEGKLWS